MIMATELQAFQIKMLTCTTRTWHTSRQNGVASLKDVGLNSYGKAVLLLCALLLTKADYGAHGGFPTSFLAVTADYFSSGCY